MGSGIECSASESDVPRVRSALTTSLHLPLLDTSSPDHFSSSLNLKYLFVIILLQANMQKAEQEKPKSDTELSVLLKDLCENFPRKMKDRKDYCLQTLVPDVFRIIMYAHFVLLALTPREAAWELDRPVVI